MKITPEIANKIWDILTEHAGARDSDGYRRHEFVGYVCGDDNFIEYRFGGLLGSGGKFKNINGDWYVSFYSEDTTPEKIRISREVNVLLMNLKNELTK